MTALLGGLRVLDGNAEDSKHGVLTTRVGTLSNDYFVNLLDIATKWQKSPGAEGLCEGVDRTSGKGKWTAREARRNRGARAPGVGHICTEIRLKPEPSRALTHMRA